MLDVTIIFKSGQSINFSCATFSTNIAKNTGDLVGYSFEQAWELCALSSRLGRQIGVLVNRQGKAEYVLLGTATGLVIPPLGRYRLGTGRLRGLGLLHTHLSGEEISQEDLMDLLFLRLDFLAVLIPDKNGTPKYYQYSHLMPDPGQSKPYYVSGLLD